MRRDATDVIVVGGGGAGMAAAIEAARHGRRVTLVEKNPALGGSTAWSVGSISASNTRLQRAEGIVDHPDAHFEDLELLAGDLAQRDNTRLRRILVDHSTEMLAWLESLGLVFAGPNIEPPHRVRRMHNVLPNSRAFPHALGRECRRLGVDIRLNSLVERLIVEDDEVVGVCVRTDSAQTSEIRCAGGVVLAGGDYSASAELKEQFAGPETANLEAVNPTATGDAIKLGMDLGATVLNGDLVRGPIMRFVPPTRQNLLQRLPPNRIVAFCVKAAMRYLPQRIQRPFAMGFLTTALGVSHGMFAQGAILVNSDGERFCDERDSPNNAVPLQPGRQAWIVMDRHTTEKFQSWPHFVSTAPGIAYAYIDDYRRNRKDIFHTGTVAEIADSMGVPHDSLLKTIESRENADGPGLGDGPYTALGPVRSFVIFTEGGFDVSDGLEVQGKDAKPIPGLFAAGSTGQGGLLLEGHGHHLGWAFISGRIAGRNAALRVPATAETLEN